MDKAVRESVASLWELLWSEAANGTDTEYYDHILNTARAMRSVMDAGGVSVKEVADLIRDTKPQINHEVLNSADAHRNEYGARDKKLSELFGSGLEVKTGRVLELCYELKDKAALVEKEQKFVGSVIAWVGTTGKKPSFKQLCWLRDLVLRHKIVIVEGVNDV